MKLTVLILLLSMMGALASKSYSQVNKLTMNVKDVRVEDFLRLIEDQSLYRFFYSGEINVDQKMSGDFNNATINEILDEALEGKGIKYEITGRQVILSPATISVSNQQKTITGKVTDSSGAPLPGVTVIVKGTTQGIITDFDGKYALSNVPADATLQFSFVGMKPQEVNVAGKNTISITMVEDAIGIDEVIAVGYGTQKKVNLTGSVATINSEKLTVAPVASTSNILAGQLPGLISKQESGLPGSDNASLSIRGFGTPLVIVDGVESNFNNIDANEIESISVLKDASAAIYGSRAGDGVILVTTKRGSMNKPTITLNSSCTFQGVTRMPKMASSGQMAELYLEENLNSGKPESSARFTPEEIKKFYAGNDPDYPNTDWLKIAIRNWAPQQQHNLSIRGGNDKIKYYGFFGFLDQQTLFKKNGGEYKRYNLRSNIDAKILDNLSLQLDISGIIENRDFPWRDERSQIWQDYWTTEPFWNPTLPNGSLAYGGASSAVSFASISNSKIFGYSNSDNSSYKGTLSLKYDSKLIKGLSALGSINYDQQFNFNKNFLYFPASYSYNYSNSTYTQRTSTSDPQLQHTDSKSRSLTGQFSLNYDRTFLKDHHINALALYEVIDYYADWISAMRYGFATTSIDYLFAGGVANQKANGSASEMGRQSLVSRINYSYKSKYLLEGTLRVDESAKFSKKSRRGVFPSISLGWRLSEEEFVKNNIPMFENLKLRASLSHSGKDDVGNFQYLSGYGYDLPYLIGSTVTNGLYSTGLANPLLTWENMTTSNLGLDFGLPRKIFYGELDFFYRDRKGIPGTKVASLPTTFGESYPTVNLNTINTRGFEVMIGHAGHLNDLHWDVNANISWSRSKWGFYDEPIYSDPDMERLNKLTGRWTDVTFGYKSDGLFTSQQEIDALTFKYDEATGNSAVKPGDIRYMDVNKDGLLNWRDKVDIGKGNVPHWIGGSNVNLRYKSFNINALFQGAFGFYQKIIFRYVNANFSEFIYNERWTPENNRSNGLLPRLGGTVNEYDSDFYYKKSDYIRLKTLSVGYNLQNFLVKKMNLSEMYFYISGTNLLTISGLNKYCFDPEAPSGQTGHYYPQMRTVSLGLKLSF